MSLDYVLVTGSSGGVGRAISGRLADEGLVPLLHYNTGVASAQTLQSSIAATTGMAPPIIQADLSAASGLEHLQEELTARFKNSNSNRLAGVVNNAAQILGPRFDEITLENYDEYFNLNVRAPLIMAKEAGRLMEPGGSIVNISSMAAVMGQPSNALYAMSKAALESSTVHIAAALASQQIRVNTLRLGFTDNGHPAFQQPAVREYVESYAAIGGVADPEHVADAVLFLLRTGTRMTGSVLDLTGGSWPKPPRSNLSVRKIAETEGRTDCQSVNLASSAPQEGNTDESSE